MSTLRPVPAAEARHLLAEAAARRPPRSEEVLLEEAVGRVLSAPVAAGEDLPPHARSAVDGYAVRAADAGPLAIVGSVTMGERPGVFVGERQAVAIPTGGALPAGADAVVMVEDTAAAGGEVVILRMVAPGRNVIQAGEDWRRGSVVLAAGRRIRSTDVAALALLGCARVAAYRRPRVAVLSTGAELCPAAISPPPGAVRDVNQPALAAMAAAAGGAITCAGIAGDDPEPIARALATLTAAHDLVLVSGGSSVGRRDHTAEAMGAIGTLLFHGIEARPGRPTLAAEVGSAIVLGLPGVPAAALVIFAVLGRPLLRRLGGDETAEAPVRALLAAAHRSAPRREEYLRVRLVDGQAQILPGGLASLVAADGLVIVPADATELDAGTPVDVWPLP